MNPHLSQETLDLLQLAALPPAATTSARTHLGACPSCAQRLSALEADARHFEQFVFARSLPKVEAKARPAGLFSLFTWKAWVPALGLAAALGVVGVMKVSVDGGGPGTGSQTEDEVYIGLKGGPQLAVYGLHGAGEAFQVQPDATLKPKDRLRFVVRPAGAKWVMVASRDGAGAFSVYHPFGAQGPAQLTGAPKVELPGAVELDDTAGTEQLVAVFSEAPFTAADVEAALKANPADPRVAGARVVTLTFRKAQAR